MSRCHGSGRSYISEFNEPKVKVGQDDVRNADGKYCAMRSWEGVRCVSMIETSVIIACSSSN